MTEIFLVDLVFLVHLVYLVKEMNEKNQIDQTNEIGDFTIRCFGFKIYSLFDCGVTVLQFPGG